MIIRPALPKLYWHEARKLQSAKASYYEKKQLSITRKGEDKYVKYEAVQDLVREERWTHSEIFKDDQVALRKRATTDVADRAKSAQRDMVERSIGGLRRGGWFWKLGARVREMIGAC